jgi:O-antigen/teichoic acid export membrane protein
MHIGKTIAANILTGSIGRVINALTPLLLVPLLIRSWGLHQYGEWLILTAVPTYIMLSPDFGLAGAVINQMAIVTASNMRDEAIRLYRTSWLILTVLSLVFSFAGLCAGILVSWGPLGVTELSEAAAVIISASCFQIFLGQQVLLITGVYRSAGMNPRCGLIGSIGGAMYFTAAIATLALKGSPLQFVAVTTVARILFLAIMLFDARRIMPDFTLGIKGVSFRVVKPYIIPGLGHATMPLVNSLQNEGMLLVLGVILGPVSVAVFQTTRTAVNGAKSLMGLFATAVAVEIPTLVGARRIDSVRQLLVMNTQVALIISFGWILLIGLSGEPIFGIWLHNRAVYSAPLALIILVSLLPFSVANSFTVMLLATNMIHEAVVWLLPAGVLSLAVTAVGARFLGLSGAAIGLVIFETLSFIVICSVTARHAEVDVRHTLTETVSRRSISTSYRSALSALGVTRV